jgi:hypothetical protein
LNTENGNVSSAADAFFEKGSSPTDAISGVVKNGMNYSVVKAVNVLQNAKYVESEVASSRGGSEILAKNIFDPECNFYVWNL